MEQGENDKRLFEGRVLQKEWFDNDATAQNSSTLYWIDFNQEGSMYYLYRHKQRLQNELLSFDV